MKYKEQQEYVAGLRELADFIEGHIEVPLSGEFKITQWVYDSYMTKHPYDVIAGSAKRKLRTATLALGNAEKVWSNLHLDVRRKFSDNVILEFTVARERVCERVVTGTREVDEIVIAARTEEIVEWQCTDSILA